MMRRSKQEGIAVETQTDGPEIKPGPLYGTETGPGQLYGTETGPGQLYGTETGPGPLYVTKTGQDQSGQRLAQD